MSHDVKYIGMDVHKEATVIAVLNGTGKLVMESNRGNQSQYALSYDALVDGFPLRTSVQLRDK